HTELSHAPFLLPILWLPLPRDRASRIGEILRQQPALRAPARIRPTDWGSPAQSLCAPGSSPAAGSRWRWRPQLIEKRVGVGLGVEGDHIVNLFAGADE